jgi:hypothetical protein
MPVEQRYASRLHILIIPPEEMAAAEASQLPDNENGRSIHRFLFWMNH